MESCNVQIWTQTEGERGEHRVYFIHMLSGQGTVTALSLTPTRGCVLYIPNTVSSISVFYLPLHYNKNAFFNVYLMYFLFCHFTLGVFNKKNASSDLCYPIHFFPGSSAARWPPLGLFREAGDSLHSVRSRRERQKQKQSLHMSPAQKWPLGVINHDVRRCGHLETILPTVCSAQQALFTQVCSGTQLYSTQTNSLILNKWAIDFCLLSEQPEAFWTTIVSPI